MKGQMTGQKITIKTAAQLLGVSTKTIQRYLSKGRLTRLKEGTRTLLLLPEVKGFEVDPSLGQGRLFSGAPKGLGSGHIGDTVTLSRERYEQLLLELGELRKQNQFFLEFKSILAAREESIRRLERDLGELRERVHWIEMGKRQEYAGTAKDGQEAESEPEQAKRKGKKPWWQV
jgi:excisionase family DNA binding protein